MVASHSLGELLGSGSGSVLVLGLEMHLGLLGRNDDTKDYSGMDLGPHMDWNIGWALDSVVDFVALQNFGFGFDFDLDWCWVLV